MSDENKCRWKLLGVDCKGETFSILDELANKKRIYHVPKLTRVNLIDSDAYIFTSATKAMRLDVATGTRKFLSGYELNQLVDEAPAGQVSIAAAR